MAADEANSPKGADKNAPGRRTPRRRAKPPVTIDLEATSVSTGQAESEAKTDAPPPELDAEGRTEGEAEREIPAEIGETPRSDGPANWPGIATAALAGVVGGLAALAFVLGLQAGSVLPTPGGDAAAQALAETNRLTATVSGHDQRLSSSEAASAADRTRLDDLAKQVATVNALGNALSDRLLNLEEGTGSTASKETVDALTDRVQRLESTPAGEGEASPTAGLTALQSRVESLAGELAALKATVDEIARQSPSATERESTMAMTSLRQAADRGGPFAAELAMAERLGITGDEMAELAPLAQKGAPSRNELMANFPSVADAILAAERSSDPSSGLLDRVLSYGGSLVKVRPAGPIPGNGPVAVVSRMQAAVGAGDLATALSERQALPPEAQAASQQWATEVTDRLAIDRLLDQLSEAHGPAVGSG